MVKCPKCAFENRSGAVECGRCGVILAKAISADERAIERPAPTARPTATPVVSREPGFSTKPSREERRRAKMLRKLEPLASHLLEDGETILATAEATGRYGLLEFLTTGWIIAYLKRCVLIFTDRRILQVLTTPGYQARGSWAEIRYADIVTFKTSRLFGKLDLTMRDGSKARFVGIPRRDAKPLKDLIGTWAGTGERSGAGARRFCCPRCSAALVDGQVLCVRCGFGFKTSDRALKLSLLVPGGGYFYTAHPLMGIADFLIESYLILLIILMIFVPGEDPVVAMIGAGFIGFILLIEKLVTIYHARHYVREFIPAGRRNDWKQQLKSWTPPKQTAVPATPPKLDLGRT